MFGTVFGIYDLTNEEMVETEKYRSEAFYIEIIRNKITAGLYNPN